jgi:hypothetical protein
MAAKGALSKEIVMAKILEVFPDAFVYDKAIRIPMIEDGSPLQIKVALTAAKDIVEMGADNALPVSTPKAGSAKVGEFSFPAPQKIEISESEQSAVQDLMSTLGL